MILFISKKYNSCLFCKAIIVKVSLGVRFLISEVVVDSDYGGHAKGLMGNFDGNPTNDFILPNGTILNKNSTKTEREIYNNFGQQCKISFDRKTYFKKIKSINVILLDMFVHFKYYVRQKKDSLYAIGNKFLKQISFHCFKGL